MGSKPQLRSCRGILEQLKPGDSHVFPCPEGMTYRRLQGSITAVLCRYFNDTKTEFTQRRALLVFDEHEAPVACSVVTRQPQLT